MKKRYFVFLFCNLLLVNIFSQVIECDNLQIRDAYTLAVNTIEINTRRGVLAAGGDYGGEWTRDCAINSWNCVSILNPKVAENSLWSVTENKVEIGHQYWDKIIWTIAALNHYKITGDMAFLKQAYICSRNTMKQLENSVFDKQFGLFKGPAVFADGIAAYPEPVFDKNVPSSYVLDHSNSQNIKCLSTNCTYYGAYLSLVDMAEILQIDSQIICEYKAKAENLKSSILKYFYVEKENYLNYLIDQTGKPHKYQEAVGYSFAVIFNILTKEQALKLTENANTSKFGIATLFPDFPRYSQQMPGRHNNILWPMTNGFFAQACMLVNNTSAYEKELNGITSLALDEDKGNYQFWEIYNPTTGKPDGGFQYSGNKVEQQWGSCRLQTWSATAYVNMVHFGLAGMRINKDEIKFEPYLPDNIRYLKLTNIQYRQSNISVTLIGKGRKIRTFLINGARQDNCSITADAKGCMEVFIELE